MALAGCFERDPERDKGGCSGPPPPVESGIASAGGATPVPTVEIALRTTAGGIVVAAENEPAAVTLAPQGGFILLAGVRAWAMDVCIDITAAIKDPEQDDAIVSLEMRPNQLVQGADGWLYPHQPIQLFNWANLPACQTGIFVRDFVGEPYLLEITATDGDVTSTATRTIVPYCAFEDAFCVEECTLSTSFAIAR